jgi:Uma2 family endonuclease
VVETITYPESDGKPMADNSVQFRYITTIEGNLEILFQDDPDVFIAGDMFWYPVEDNNQIRAAPDVMVVFGRPKGDRGSYLQWREGGITPQVVFEILSPGNTKAEMEGKFNFYERYGVEEYYLYDPEKGRLLGWLRAGSKLVEIEQMSGWVSPLRELI